ncbi:MAG: hypothetical protein JNK82_13460 [Myxococcaceae bacterium]|nr:hypothetical protein [Myxococcaceae bacterium]
MRSVLLLLLLLGCANEPEPPAAATAQTALVNAPRLSPTRQLRRVHLAVRGVEPTLQQYQAALDAADAGTFPAFLDAQLDAALASPEFADAMLGLGHDWLKVGDYKRGSTEGGTSAQFKGSHAVRLDRCAAGTRHAGALGLVSGSAASQCDDAAATLNVVEPWWAPGTTVTVIGRAGTGARTDGTTDCGRINMGNSDNALASANCSCGPNLVYCVERRQTGPVMYPRDYEATPYLADSQRRMLFEEPARLFAHIVVNDRPFTDLVLGTYTVAPRALQHLYVRWGRNNTDNAMMDLSSWWRSADDTWKQVEVPSLHPNLLAERQYSFDPRTDDGAPRGVPAAGVLTMLGPNVWYPRERVRAARWLEILACRNFTAPDPSVVFTPAFNGDPYASGSCQHCHRTIDPAAIHFKRLEVEDDTPRHGVGHANFGGIGSWQWRRTTQPGFADAKSPGGYFWYQPYGRWHVNFAPDTFLTPVPAARIMANADARFLDFLPAGEKLFGLEGDGTIGPLGFAKLLVQSGEYDRCAVDRLFERFMGRPLDLTKEGATETALTTQFVQGGRKVKPFIKQLLLSDEAARGL